MAAEERPPPSRPPAGLVAAICLTIAASYTCSALASTYTQVDCKYAAAFTLQYIHEALLGVLSVLGLFCFGMPSRAEARRMLRQQLRWALLLAPLSLGANVAFMVALRLTSTSSAVALEQLTSLFIALLSFLVLGTRYSLLALPLLLAAVGGAVLATLGDASKQAAGAAPLQGDLLTLVVALLASVYMVLFKLVLPSLTPQEFLFFFTLKAIVTVGIGWAGVLAFNLLGWERTTWPSGCAVVWLPLATVLSAVFNWSLGWGTLKISPLTARLSLLLGIPCSFLVDIARGKPKGWESCLGVLLVLAGVVGFEVVSARRRAPPAHVSGDDEAGLAVVTTEEAGTGS